MLLADAATDVQLWVWYVVGLAVLVVLGCIFLDVVERDTAGAPDGGLTNADSPAASTASH
jgi:hypothetical protein